MYKLMHIVWSDAYNVLQSPYAMRVSGNHVYWAAYFWHLTAISANHEWAA